MNLTCLRMDLFCVRGDQRVLATRKHESWECPGNTLINHTHMKDSESVTSLAQEFWDTDQVLFARGVLPFDWLLASELAECNEVKMWESVDVYACAKNHVLFASDGSGRSRKIPLNTETGRIWSGHFRHAHSQRHILHSAAILDTWEVRCQAGRRFHGPNSGEPSKFSAESMGRRTSKFRLMRGT